jgi:hypothetical protein
MDEETCATQRDRQTLEERLNDLERKGIIVSSGQPKAPLNALGSRPGALKRFLDDRNE